MKHLFPRIAPFKKKKNLPFAEFFIFKSWIWTLYILEEYQKKKKKLRIQVSIGYIFYDIPIIRES